MFTPYNTCSSIKLICYYIVQVNIKLQFSVTLQTIIGKN